MNIILEKFLESISMELQIDNNGNLITPINLNSTDNIIENFVSGMTPSELSTNINISPENQNQLNKLYLLYLFLDFIGYQYANRIDENIGYWRKEGHVRLSMLYIRILGEITYLLQGGYASAALARLRAVYEIGVYMEIIYNNDEALAENFLIHHQSENIKLVKLLKNADAVKDKLIEGIANKYNRDLKFWNEYQWARPLINKKRIKFRDLVNLTSYSNLYYLYSSCCTNVHATIYDSLYNVSLSKEDRGKSIWLTTPNENGIQEVIQVLLLFSDQIIRQYFKLDNPSSAIALVLLSNILGNIKTS